MRAVGLYCPATTSRLRLMRDGHSITRKEKIPKPVVLVDTREKDPLPLCENHPNWIAAERRATLRTGDYTVEGMEDLLALIYTSTLRELSTERAASWLSKHFTYWWLEQHGHGRVLMDTDGL